MAGCIYIHIRYSEGDDLCEYLIPIMSLKQKEDEKHLDEYPPHVLTEAVEGVRGKASLAAVEQIRVIPTAGERKVTSNLEWWLYTLFCKSVTNLGAYRRLLRSRSRYRLVRRVITAGSSYRGEPQRLRLLGRPDTSR
jgi:hypothetical protein